MYVSDVHVPHNDEYMTERFLEDLRAEKPDYVILGGDILDMWAVSAHSKDPKDGQELNEEFDAAKIFLKQVRKAAKKAQIVYLEGNHEARLRKYLLHNAGAIAGLKSLELATLLDLDTLDIEWVPDTQLYFIDDFLFRHGHEMFGFSGVPGNNARKGIATYHSNYIQGHIHKANVMHVGNARVNFIGVENPCLCSMDPSYMKGAASWQQGYTIGEQDDNERWQIRQVVR